MSQEPAERPRRQHRQKQDQEQKRPRSTAEWVTFSVACAVLALVVGAVASLRVDGRPRSPEFTVSSVGTSEHQGRFHLRARVVNDGEEAAQNVQVAAELQIPGQPPVEAEQVIDFLSGGDHEELVFVFSEDPEEGEVELEVRSFQPR